MTATDGAGNEQECVIDLCSVIATGAWDSFSRGLVGVHGVVESGVGDTGNGPGLDDIPVAVPGDTDGDGSVTARDVGLLLDALGTVTTDPGYDLDGDGIVTELDLVEQMFRCCDETPSEPGPAVLGAWPR